MRRSYVVSSGILRDNPEIFGLDIEGCDLADIFSAGLLKEPMVAMIILLDLLFRNHAHRGLDP